MKLIKFHGCKTLTVIIILLILFIFYHNSMNLSFGHHINEELIETKSPKTANTTENYWTTSRRTKRFVIFQGVGVVKLVFGTSYPIIMADKQRSLNYFYNFQMQYSPPTIPLYWWSLYNTSTFPARKLSIKRSADRMHNDKSRTLIYEFMETLLERSGSMGKQCLLKLICDVAGAPLVEDVYASKDGTLTINSKDIDDENGILDDGGRKIYHKVINAIFTPSYSNVDQTYLNARVAGQNGVNCNKTFGECPIVDKMFNIFTQFI